MVVEWGAQEVQQFPLVSGVQEVLLRRETAEDRSNRHIIVYVAGMQEMHWANCIEVLFVGAEDQRHWKAACQGSNSQGYCLIGC